MRKKPLDGGAHHHRPPIDGKQQQAVVQAAENLVEVFAQGAENFPHSAQLHSDLADLRADLAEFIVALERLLVEFAFGDAVQLRGDALSSGAREMLLTIAASKTEIPTEARASSAAERNAGVILAAQQAGLHRDANRHRKGPGCRAGPAGTDK